MSQTTLPTEMDTQSDDENETDDEGSPDIEADLVSEELKIDGICGVY